MSARITVIDRIIAAIAVEIQAVGGFGVEVGGIIGRDKSTPFGRIIPGVAVVQTGVVIVVIAAVANGVGVCNSAVGSFSGNRAITPGIVEVLV